MKNKYHTKLYTHSASREYPFNQFCPERVLEGSLNVKWEANMAYPILSISLIQF